jgi:hypothetical protein
LFINPDVVPVAFTETVHDVLGPNVPLDKLTEEEPTTPEATPPQVLLRLLGVATTRPAGKLSVKAILVRVTPKFGLVMLKVSEVTPFRGILAAPNALLMIGGLATVRVKICVASDPTPLCAVIVSTSTSSVPDKEVPASVAVPFPLSIKVIPAGNIPVSLNDGAGNPIVVTVKVPATPTSNVVLFALVMDGAAVPLPLTARVWGYSMHYRRS